MTHFDIFIIIALLYQYYKKKGLSKNKTMRNIFIIVLCVLPLRMFMLWHLLIGNVPYYYKKKENINGASAYLYDFEKKTVAFSINFLPLFYPAWVPISFGLTYVRQEFFPDFYKNSVDKKNKEECLENNRCDKYLSKLVRTKNYKEYQNLYKKYYPTPRRSRCEESRHYIGNTGALYKDDYKKVYEDIGEDIYSIIKEDNCRFVSWPYLKLLFASNQKEKIPRFVEDMCNKEGERFCYRNYYILSYDYINLSQYGYLKELNRKLCKQFDGFKIHRKNEKLSPPVDSLCTKLNYK